jgi:UDP-glucose 4-epimerase
VRDYIHIDDLSKGHVVALSKLQSLKTNYDVFNLGSGVGYSVYEVVSTYEEVLGTKLNWGYTERRQGDVPKLVADPSKVNK